MKKGTKYLHIKWISKVILMSTVIIGYSQGFASGKLTTAREGLTGDTSVSAYIGRYLKGGNSLLFSYPRSVKRFYETYGEETAWVNQSNTRQTWQAMMLLDCVQHYGLSYNDYHPKELLYDPLHTMIEQPGKISNDKKARFDLLLTDALITLMNNMHYGKLNPEYSADKIDEGLMLPFHAETALLNARQQSNFIGAIESAQPHSRLFASMQDKLRQFEGVYKADCYEIPASEILKIAINMERVRWANLDTNVYVQVNIPSFTLQYIRPDTAYSFKVVVGKTTAPTPTLNSEISYFTTFPEWKIPRKIFINELLPKGLKDASFFDNNHYSIYDKSGNYIPVNKNSLLLVKQHPDQYYARQSSGCDNALGQLVFRFRNVYDIYLHDTPEQQLFDAPVRAFSHSCIRVERAQQLAELMLKSESDKVKTGILQKAMKKQRSRNISLNTPIPIKITYLTCIVKLGEVITYDDIYNLDKSLELALYSSPETLTIK